MAWATGCIWAQQPENSDDHVYYLPHVTAEGEKNSFLGAVHFGDTGNVAIAVEGYSSTGESLGMAAGETELVPGGKLWLNVTEAFADRASEVAWLRVIGTETLYVFTALRGPKTLSAYGAVGSLEGRVFMPHIAKNTARFATFLASVNGLGSPVQTTATPHPLGPSVSIAAHESGLAKSLNDVRDFFGDDLAGVDWVEIVSGNGDGQPATASMEFFEVLPERCQQAALGLHGRSGKTLRFLHVARDVGQFWTGLVYLNVGDETAQVEETYFGDRGQVVSRRAVSLAAGQKVDPIPLFDPFNSEPEGTSWVSVEADQPLVGYELFGAPISSGHDYFAGLQAHDDAAPGIAYPHVASSANEFTGLVAVNLGDVAGDLRFTAMSADGQALAESTLPDAVPPKAKVAVLVRDLFAPEVVADTAWVRALGSQSTWAGFALWGDLAVPRQQLAALNAFAYTPPEPKSRVLLDDAFGDWQEIAPAHEDPAGDQVAGTLDLGSLWMANDEAYLFLSFEVGSEINLQNDNELALFIDTDRRAETGLAVQGIGAELDYRFGNRAGAVRLEGELFPIGHPQIGLISAPTITSTRFEIALRRDAVLAGKPLFPFPEIRVALQSAASGGDALPNTPGGVPYRFDEAPSAPLPGYLLTKPEQDWLRLLSYNVEVDGFFETSKEPIFTRVLRAIQPEIIAFQEIFFHSSAQTADLVETMLPSAPGQTWYHAKTASDVAAVSRFPIMASHSLSSNAAFLLDLRPAFSTDLLLVVAHPPCCTANAQRQLEFDELMAFIRDAQRGLAAIQIEFETPIVIAGDMNLVGFSQQLRTLLHGDIVNEQIFGADFQPDWNGTSLADARAFTTGLPMMFTWFNESSAFSPGRLDYVFYTDSVIQARNQYVLFTRALDPETLATFGLFSEDTVAASDHLPLVVDFEFNRERNPAR